MKHYKRSQNSKIPLGVSRGNVDAAFYLSLGLPRSLASKVCVEIMYPTENNLKIEVESLITVDPKIK